MRLGRILLLLALVLPRSALAQDPDSGVARALKRAGVRYQVDEDGDFQVVFELEGGRTQLAVVRTPVETYGSIAVREILSPAHQVAGELDGALARTLLQDNERRKMGAWQILVEEGSTLVVFNAKIPARTRPKDLLSYLLLVVQTADEMELRLNQGDAF